MSKTYRRRTALALSALAATAVVAAGCGGSDDDDGGDAQGKPGGTVTLTFANWSAGEETTRPMMLEVIKQFEAAHPNIKIESEALSFTEIGKNLVLRVRSGNPPDVAQLAGNDTYAVAATKSLAPLDDTLGDIKGDLLPNDVEGGTVDGQWVAMPWSDGPQGFWFNRKLMRQAGLDPANPPATLDDLNTAMAQIKRELPDVIPLGIDTTNRSFGLDSQWSWMAGFGAQPFSGDEATSNTPEMQQYLQWVRDVVKNGYTLANRKIGDFRPLAAQDKVVFVFDQPFLQSVVQATNGQSDKEFYDTWGVTTQPVGPVGEPHSTQLGHQLVMFQEAVEGGKAEAAAEFMKFLATSPEAVKEFTIKAVVSLPPLQEVPPELEDALDTPVFREFREKIIPTASLPGYGPSYSAGFSPVMAGVQSAITSSDPLDAVSEQMQVNLEQAIG